MWSNWGTCSTSCGPGVKKRTRACTNPEPEYGGLTCRERDLGANTESSKCNLGDCPGKYLCCYLYENTAICLNNDIVKLKNIPRL